ncbi:MAG: flagellar export protein FliJ [Firmicutes bacterium]|nr:flagellar export protein FliJ [Bacillota bacterium]
MRRFTFRLETVLRHKKALEEQATVTLAKAQEEFRRCWENLLRTNALLEQTFKEPATGGFDLTEVMHLAFYREHLNERRKLQEEEVGRAKAKLKEQRTQVVARRRDKLLLEKLREKEFAAYRIELFRAEQKELDEQGVFKRGSEGADLFLATGKNKESFNTL